MIVKHQILLKHSQAYDPNLIIPISLLARINQITMSEGQQIVQNQQQGQAIEQEQVYDYDPYEDPYYQVNSLEPAKSIDKPYNAYYQDVLANKIYQQNVKKCDLTALAPAWNLVLYFICEFSDEKVSKLLDQQQTGRRIIRYNQKYKPQIKNGQCPICMSQTGLISNVCGHSFCVDCWNQYLKIKHRDRSCLELFPLCQWDRCYHKTNFMLMEKVWEKYPAMKQYFDKLLCVKYAQMSLNIRHCNRQNCGKFILINFTADVVLVCDCGNKICKFCGQYDHFPLNCGDLLAWNKIMNQKQNQWIQQIVTQKCPECKTPIDKNGGCIHMTCPCGHQFCWICLKMWQGHGGSFYQCNSIKRQDHQQRLKEQQQKKKKNQGEYSMRFQQAKSQIQRLDYTLKRLHAIQIKKINQILRVNNILTSDLINLGEIRDIITSVFELCHKSQIYSFFQLQGYAVLKKDLIFLNKMASQLDDYLTHKLKLTEEIQNMEEECKKANTTIAKQVNISLKEEFFKNREQNNLLKKKLQAYYEELKQGRFMDIKSVKK